jgi:methionyl-tRNA formyltransferase
MKNTLCFVGSTSRFSLVALQTLLKQQIPVRQIIFAGYPPATPASNTLPVSPPPSTATTPSIPLLAAQHHIPIHYAGDDINHFSTWKDFPHADPPDYLFVACFPFRIPAPLRQWPTTLAVNLHPSLLPAYRGPDPLFWQLRQGETNTGFSLHVLVEELDAGPVLLQQAVIFPSGASRNELDTLLAQQGTEAFCRLLSTSTLSTEPLHATEQNPHAASYHPPPQPQDYALDTDWSAQRAYNFIRGTRTPAEGYPIRLDGRQIYIETALAVEADRTLGNSAVPLNGEILIQFSPGVLHAKPV